MKCICLFTRDLRISDNTALMHVAKHGSFLAVYYNIYAKNTACYHRNMEAAYNLNYDMQGRLVFISKIQEIEKLVKKFNIKQIHYNDYITISPFIGNAETIQHKDKLLYPFLEKDYRKYSFTHFYNIQSKLSVRKPEYFAGRISLIRHNISNKMQQNPKIGERTAVKKISLMNQDTYKNRNRLDLDASCRLSDHINHGEVSIRKVFYMSQHIPEIIRQICWREFNYNVLHFHPYAYKQDLKQNSWPRLNKEDEFLAWTKGCTGFPIIDAIQKQLVIDKFINNRARQISASFLTKYLANDWQKGENWFKMHLSDYDRCNNIMGWQWCAGTGTDYLKTRTFNPKIQTKNYDPNCSYIKSYLPAFASLTSKDILEGKRPACYPKEIISLEKRIKYCNTLFFNKI